MARYEKVVSVFLASPNDVQEEREIVEAVIQELNKTWSQNLNLRLDLIKWETDVYPNVADYGQDVVNQQVNDEYDIFIAVFWGRAGTATPVSDSGSIEELERALVKHKKNPELIDIMIYFKDEAIPPSEIDLEQLQTLKSLKAKLEKNGSLCSEFEKVDQFSSLLRIHLSKAAQKWSKQLSQNKSMQTHSEKFDAKESEDDHGILDFIESYEDNIAAMNKSIIKMSEATEQVGTEIGLRSKEIEVYQVIPGQVNVKETKKLIKKASQNMNSYSDVMEKEVKVLEVTRTAAFDALSKAISFYVDHQEDHDEVDFADVKLGLKEFIVSIEGANESLIDFRSSIGAWPKLTADLNKAKSRSIKVLEQFLEQSKFIIITSNNIVSSIEQIENN